MRISGSVAIVTGGARGFGKAFTEELLKRGGKVCIADVNVSEGLKTEQTFKQKYGNDTSMFMKCDVTNDAEFKGLWKAAIERFKAVDIMVNNAGILNENLPEKTIEINLSTSKSRQVIPFHEYLTKNVDFPPSVEKLPAPCRRLGAMRGTNLAIQHMRKDLGGKGGLIVNVASTGGLFPVFFMPAYAASKYGVVGYTRSWAANPLVNEFGLSFACFCPAFSDTNMLTDTMHVDNPPLITYTENKELVTSVVEGLGINKLVDVASAFIELVEKPDNNGAVVTIEKKKGSRYHFTEHPHKL